jgi:hypothetical protein
MSISMIKLVSEGQVRLTMQSESPRGEYRAWKANDVYGSTSWCLRTVQSKNAINAEIMNREHADASIEGKNQQEVVT